MTSTDDPTDERELRRREAWRWVLHMTSGDAKKVDIVALERWCAQSPLHGEAFAHASGRWRAFGPAMENVARQHGAMAVGHVSEGGHVFGVGQTVGRRAFLGGALAASAAGVTVLAIRPPFGLWPSFDELAADYRTATGEQHRIALADRVSVELNTRTSVNIREAASDDVDRVELISGETAVATGSHKIEVIAASGRAWARTAQFNVRYEGGEVCVTCLGGSVQVEQRGQSAIVQQNQQVSYTQHSLGQMTAIDPAVVMAWRDGDIFFQNQPLLHVIDEVNRYRPGKIVLMNEGLGRRRVTAHFKLDRLEVVITQLRETFGARVTQLPGGITLVS
jgi:transmembrane sensor